MKIPLLIPVCTLALTLAGQAAEDGWTPLFNGKDLTGWVQRGGKAKYSVENGMILGRTVTNTPNSFLCTEQTYGDFVLELEFKVNPALNSGVQIRSECFDAPKVIQAEGKEIKIAAGRVHGYQVEIDMDPVKKRWWAGGLYDEGRRAWLYPGPLGGDPKAFTEQGGKISKPDGWNTYRVEARGNSIKTWLNSQLRASITDGMTPRGFIALQVHSVPNKKEMAGMEVAWRNIRIKELK